MIEIETKGIEMNPSSSNMYFREIENHMILKMKLHLFALKLTARPRVSQVKSPSTAYY